MVNVITMDKALIQNSVMISKVLIAPVTSTTQNFTKNTKKTDNGGAHFPNSWCNQPPSASASYNV